MIKASDIGLQIANCSNDVLANCHKEREKFYQMIKDQQDEKIFNELNVPKKHNVIELIALMTYKGINIKAHIHPHIFFEVAELLKKQQEELEEYRKDKIYTEEDL